jgi:hypothetical protein
MVLEAEFVEACGKQRVIDDKFIQQGDKDAKKERVVSSLKCE